ncbi:methionine adenosyltransferase [Natranaerovirga hydrolytica]|uniref:S-adenosylmethionine synthase n=1 Tax=Natranaerovirga hydrolytica TaxID=680378 RepID=A0A4R1MDU3_9FIRM|nr:methionine adenosyltransferase [Natranaerovirga hydrolytica]TCK88023.1 methionine adenosyltransferase [Natranaerovirga hydrolytica]
MNTFLITSEAVTEGHPDKIADQISDGILDAYLQKDSQARVAIETMVSKNTIMIAGEISSNAKVDTVNVAREIVKDIGYEKDCIGFDYESVLIMTNINTQSSDIAQGVNANANKEKSIGAGDQGIMYGFACDETHNYMPITMQLSNELAMRLAAVRKDKILPWLYPDGKTQVTMKYNEKGEPLYITSIIVSAQHDEKIDYDTIYSSIVKEVIYPVIDNKWMVPTTKIHINPTGRFVLGGPAADVGLTGRKIMADTYGGVGKHGGGAFSGKDPTKVDRSAAYMARYVAKNIVAAKLAQRCEVSLAYAIGQSEPEAITVNTFGTHQIQNEWINTIVREVFSFSVSDILEELNLRKPQFIKAAAYGHFGKEDMNFQWEQLDKVECLQEKAKQYINKIFEN